MDVGSKALTPPLPLLFSLKVNPAPYLTETLSECHISALCITLRCPKMGPVETTVERGIHKGGEDILSHPQSINNTWASPSTLGRQKGTTLRRPSTLLLSFSLRRRSPALILLQVVGETQHVKGLKVG